MVPADTINKQCLSPDTLSHLGVLSNQTVHFSYHVYTAVQSALPLMCGEHKSRCMALLVHDIWIRSGQPRCIPRGSHRLIKSCC